MSTTIKLKKFGPPIEVSLPDGLYTGEILEEMEINARMDACVTAEEIRALKAALAKELGK